MKSSNDSLDFFQICEHTLWKKVGNFTWKYTEGQNIHRLSFYETGSVIYENDNQKFKLVTGEDIPYDQEKFILDLKKFSINTGKLDFLQKNIFGLDEIFDLEKGRHSFFIETSHKKGFILEYDHPFYQKLQKIGKQIVENETYVFSVQTMEYNTRAFRKGVQKLKSIYNIFFDLTGITNHQLLERHIESRKNLDSIEALKSIL